jgi:rhodanese-related sulfurtransferase
VAIERPAPASDPEISLGELRARLDDPALAVVDVLPRESFAEAHIRGARSLPLAEIAERAGRVLPDPRQEVAVYCASFT